MKRYYFNIQEKKLNELVDTFKKGMHKYLENDTEG